MSIHSRLIRFLAPTIFGLAIFYSYYTVAIDGPPQHLIDLIKSSVGRDELLLISQYLSSRDIVNLINFIANLPLALVFSFAWILIAKNISFINRALPTSILASLVPFIVIYSLYYYLNIQHLEQGFVKPLSSYGFGAMSEMLAVIFLPYYTLLLLFKAFLVSDRGQKS